MFDTEIVPVSVASRKGTIVTTCDEGVRADSSLEALKRLKPAFQPDGTVTARNASRLNDGAAMLLVCDAEYARTHHLKPLAEIVSYACIGVDPALMGLDPSSPVPLALERAQLGTGEVDLFELNEAFAAQSRGRTPQSADPREKVNVFGGAVASGHPSGASGARVLVTLVHALCSRQRTFGVASLCIGGGTESPSSCAMARRVRMCF